MGSKLLISEITSIGHEAWSCEPWVLNDKVEYGVKIKSSPLFDDESYFFHVGIKPQLNDLLC